MYERLDEITLPNGKEYIVIDSVVYKEKEYLYLGNAMNEYVIVEVIKNDGKPLLINIEDDETFRNVVNLILEKNKQFIEESLEEKGE